MQKSVQCEMLNEEICARLVFVWIQYPFAELGYFIAWMGCALLCTKDNTLIPNIAEEIFFAMRIDSSKKAFQYQAILMFLEWYATEEIQQLLLQLLQQQPIHLE